MRETLKASAWLAAPLSFIILMGHSVETEYWNRIEAEQQVVQLKEQNSQLRFEHAMMAHQHQRLNDIVNYSTEYQIPADDAAMIYDIALAEGIATDVAFRLVRLESDFKHRAVSRAGAIGLAQVMPSTANELTSRHVTLRELFEPEFNLHLGFSYLRMLLDEYKGDLRLALLAYNRGPNRVNGLLAMGEDPANGYAQFICGDCGDTGLSE